MDRKNLTIITSAGVAFLALGAGTYWFAIRPPHAPDPQNNNQLTVRQPAPDQPPPVTRKRPERQPDKIKGGPLRPTRPPRSHADKQGKDRRTKPRGRGERVRGAPDMPTSG